MLTVNYRISLSGETVEADGEPNSNVGVRPGGRE